MKCYIRHSYLTIMLFFISADLIQAGSYKPKFEHISTEQGLSHATVYSIMQDQKGLMWFGTEDGLNKYDGRRFTEFLHNPSDSAALSSSGLSHVFQDRAGMIWLGTWGGGLNRFDPESERVTAYYGNDPDNPQSLSNDRAQTVFEDSAGRLWIGTAGGGLNKFDPTNGGFIHYRHNENQANSLSHDRIWKICEDQAGFLWIATDHGLNRFDPESEHFNQYFHDPDNLHSLSHSKVRTVFAAKDSTLWVGTQNGLNRFDAQTGRFKRFIYNQAENSNISQCIINAIFEDHNGVLWIGTQGGLICCLDLDSGTYVKFINDRNDPYSLSNNDVRAIYEDCGQNLWIATRRGGINKLDLKPQKFLHYKHDPADPNSLNDNIIWSIFEGSDGTLWVGTDSGGLSKLKDTAGTRPGAELQCRFSQPDEQFAAYKNDPAKPASLSNNRVLTIYEDRQANFWIGTDGGGLNLFDRQKETFSAYKPDPQNPASISDNCVFCILEDSRGRFWIGTDGGGLNLFDRQQKQFSHYLPDPDGPGSISDYIVQVIYEDSFNTLWVGTGNGLNKFDPQTGRFKHYKNDPNDSLSISNNDIKSIYEDEVGNFWVGTNGGGLNYFDRVRETFTNYTDRDGLPNNVIYNILEDKSNCLWLSTNRGLSKFDPVSLTFRNYDVSDGLQSRGFNQNACFKSKSGFMFFGGNNGFNRFQPERIEVNINPPSVILTSFKLFDKVKKYGQVIDEVKEIRLSHNENFISYEFAALDYTEPGKNRYEYKLEGVNQKWVSTRTGYANYTNLPPGSYVFRVKGSNNDLLWNEKENPTRIVILPPFWKTWWFYLLEILIIIGIVFTFHSYQTARISRKVDLQRKSDELDYAREVQLSMLPESNLDLGNVEIVGRMVTATEIGGDYYDLVKISDKKYCFAIGDVTGHGIAAGFVVGMVKMAFTAAIKSFDRQAPVVDLVKNLNTALKNSLTQRYMGMGFGIGILDVQGQTIQLTTTGMPFPYYFKHDSGQLIPLELHGPPIGLLEEIDPRAVQVELTQGDAIILLTDGFADRFNRDKKIWGYEALEKTLVAICQEESEANNIIQSLIDECENFANGSIVEDDMTVVVLKAKEQEILSV